MPQCAEDAVTAVEQCRTETRLAADINALDEMIDEQGSTLKIYPGALHGLCATYKDQINADLLAFIKT